METFVITSEKIITSLSDISNDISTRFCKIDKPETLLHKMEIQSMEKYWGGGKINISPSLDKLLSYLIRRTYRIYRLINDKCKIYPPNQILLINFKKKKKVQRIIQKVRENEKIKREREKERKGESGGPRVARPDVPGYKRIYNCMRRATTVCISACQLNSNY